MDPPHVLLVTLEGTAVLIECKDCEAIVQTKDLGQSRFYDPEDGPPEVYTFVQCSQCGRPMLVLQCEYGRDNLDEPYRVYPPQDNRLGLRFPPSIRNAFEEVLGCMKGKAYTAAAIMCRKTLEGVCAEHGCSGKTLDNDLKQMKDKGLIESRLFEWADALRIAGNEAAHEVGTVVNKQDATDLLEFTRALLEYVFTFRDRFEEFKKRRMKAPSP